MNFSVECYILRSEKMDPRNGYNKIFITIALISMHIVVIALVGYILLAFGL